MDWLEAVFILFYYSISLRNAYIRHFGSSCRVYRYRDTQGKSKLIRRPIGLTLAYARGNRSTPLSSQWVQRNRSVELHSIPEWIRMDYRSIFAFPILWSLYTAQYERVRYTFYHIFIIFSSRWADFLCARGRRDSVGFVDERIYRKKIVVLLRELKEGTENVQGCKQLGIDSRFKR